MAKKKEKTFKEIVEENSFSRRKPGNYVYYNNRFTDDESKSILVPFSDVHYGNQYCKEKEFMDNLEWAYNKDNVILALNGDLVESKTRSRKGDGIFTQKNPQKQLEWVVDLFKPFADEGRIIGMTNGNHEDAITLETGIDITSIMANKLGVPYLKNGGFYTIKNGNQSYDFYMTHGSSGATLPYTKSKACRDLSTFIEADAYLYGHVHAKEHATQEVYHIDKRKKGVDTKQLHFILTGHYLDYVNSYAQMKSMRPSGTGTPKIKMSGLEKQIRVSL